MDPQKQNPHRVIHIILAICMLIEVFMIFGLGFLVLVFSLGSLWFITLAVFIGSILSTIGAIRIITTGKHSRNHRQKTTYAVVNLFTFIILIACLSHLSSPPYIACSTVAILLYVVSGATLLWLTRNKHTNIDSTVQPISELPIVTSLSSASIVPVLHPEPTKRKWIVSTLLFMPILTICAALFIIPIVIGVIPPLHQYSQPILVVSALSAQFIGILGLTIGLILRHEDAKNRKR